MSLPKFDVRKLVEPKRKRLLCEYYTLVTFDEWMANVPYIHQPNMMNPKRCQTAQAYLDIDHTICQLTSNDYSLFHDKQHNVSVVPSTSIEIRPNHCWLRHL